MIKTIHYTIYYFQVIVIFISLLFSFRIIKNKNTPEYFSNFYWYSIVSLVNILPQLILYMFFKTFREQVSVIHNLSILFHFCFLSIFIIRVIYNERNLKYLVSVFIFFLALIILALSYNNLQKFLPLAFTISNFGLVIFSIFYYYELFKNIPSKDLKKTPSFWVVTGIFFCMGAFLPVSGTVDYLRGKVSDLIILSLYNVMIFCYIIMHLFFIKAYLCVTHRSKA